MTNRVIPRENDVVPIVPIPKRTTIGDYITSYILYKKIKWIGKFCVKRRDYTGFSTL